VHCTITQFALIKMCNFVVRSFDRTSGCPNSGGCLRGVLLFTLYKYITTNGGLSECCATEMASPLCFCANSICNEIYTINIINDIIV